MAIKRTSEALWRGGLKDGHGRMVVGRGVFEGEYSFASRFESGEGTNPEELLAAAHAGCFTMFLSAILEKDGFKPEELRTKATVSLELKEEGPRITRMDLVVEGRVPGIDAETFKRYAEAAKEGCPVSIALAGVPEKTVEATLL